MTIFGLLPFEGFDALLLGVDESLQGVDLLLQGANARNRFFEAITQNLILRRGFARIGRLIPAGDPGQMTMASTVNAGGFAKKQRPYGR